MSYPVIRLRRERDEIRLEKIISERRSACDGSVLGDRNVLDIEWLNMNDEFKL